MINILIFNFTVWFCQRSEILTNKQLTILLNTWTSADCCHPTYFPKHTDSIFSCPLFFKLKMKGSSAVFVFGKTCFLIVKLEHRYYGKSQPFADLGVERSGIKRCRTLSCSTTTSHVNSPGHCPVPRPRHVSTIVSTRHQVGYIRYPIVVKLLKHVSSRFDVHLKAITVK